MNDPTLADLLLHQGSQLIDIVLIREASARIDLQASKAVVLAQTDLQHAEVTLQPLLLIDDQLQPAALDGGDGVA